MWLRSPKTRPPGSPKPELTLTDDERQTLTTWATHPKSSQPLTLCAHFVLACADEPSNDAVPARFNVCNATVGMWWNCFVADDDVERIITRTLET